MPFKSFTAGSSDTQSGLRQEICGICGRTLLAGETPELYFEPHGVKPVVVCPICRETVREAGYSRAS